MLILGSTSDLVRVITGSALNTDVHASWVDLVDAATTATPGRTNTLITTATTTTVVASPGASTKRTVKHLAIRNRDASSSNAITVVHSDGSNIPELIKVTLLAGEELLYLDHAWFVYDVNGAVKAASAPASSDTASGVAELAVQSEMETATDVVRIVTPGRTQYHPGVAKAWLAAGVTANILGSYNITSLTDTGTGDVAVTIATDFSGASTYAWQVTVQRTNSTAAAANARCGTIKTATLAAGTVSADCWDDTATTNVISDPTTWHMCGMGDQ